MTNALAIYKDFDGLQRAAMALYKSGYFSNTENEAQAIVKVMAGAEVGIPPFASLSGINVIQGKPTFGANLIATIVDNHPRYGYKVIRADDEACIIEWYKDGEKAGQSSFTIEEARSIKQWNKKKNAFEPLTNGINWQNYPSDMLFARAMTRGQKRYAAGVAGGAPIYTAEELGAEVDEDGNVIEGSYSEPITREDIEQSDPVDEVIEDAGPQVIDREYDFKTRPYDADTLKAALEIKAEKIEGYNASDKQRGLLRMLLNEHFQDDTKRHEASEWLFGNASTKEIDGAMVKVALDWLKPEKDDGGAYMIDATARKELSQVLTVALEAAGQEALL